MEWIDIIDKSKNCIIKADLSILAPYYTPEQVQKIIDDKDVKTLCKVTNEKLQNRSKGRKLIYISGNPDELIDAHFSIDLVA